MPKSVLVSAKKAIKGEEKLWKVFWLWGVVLYSASIVMGFLIYNNIGVTHRILQNITGALGIILVFVYPFLFCWSLWQCAFNSKQKVWGYIARIYAIIFIPFIHRWIGWWIGMASLALISNH